MQINRTDTDCGSRGATDAGQAQGRVRERAQYRRTSRIRRVSAWPARALAACLATGAVLVSTYALGFGYDPPEDRPCEPVCSDKCGGIYSPACYASQQEQRDQQEQEERDQREQEEREQREREEHDQRGKTRYDDNGWVRQRWYGDDN